MKKLYQSSDGNTFPDRLAARRHETDLTRRERLRAFFAPSGATQVTLPQVIDAIMANPKEFSRRLSARAARRSLRERSPL
jgi:hypothetical protein